MPAENLNADRAFFQVFGHAGKGAIDDELQEILAALARLEFRAREDALKLCADAFRGHTWIQTVF
jgi:hypothetical protein